MKIALLGLRGAGKKTLFRLLTGSEAVTVPPQGVPGVFPVRDPRVDALSSMYEPEKTAYARIEMLLLPDVEKTQGRAVWLDDVRNLDGIVCVARAWSSPAVFHPAGSADPRRDLDAFLSELLFADLFLMERRREKLASEQRAKRTPAGERELKAIARVVSELESGRPVRAAGLSQGEKEALAKYQFLTDKAIAGVINVTHGAEGAGARAAIADDFGSRMTLAFFDAKLEGEIAAITDAAERQAFLSGLGIREPAVAVLTRGIYDALGLMSYYTVGADEVRAWTVRKGSTAPQAARAIHSDLARGFIRVEVMKYQDLVALGGEAKVREAGRCLLKGKDYVVEDGDILSFRSAS